MRRLKLGSKLSTVSWRFIELFALAALFFLPFSKSAAEISAITALVLWVLRKWPWNEAFPRIKHVNIPYAAFLLITAASLVNVPTDLASTGLQGILKWLKHIALFFMLTELAGSPQRSKRLVGVFLVSMGLVCLNALYQSVTGADWVKNYSIDIPGRFVRLKSSLGSPNSLALFISMALPVTFDSWLKQKKWSLKSVMLTFLLAVFFIILLGTLSRSAVLALVISVANYLVLHRRAKFALLLLGFLALLAMSSKLLFNNFITSLNPSDITIGERLRYWQTTWEMIRHSPWIGNGVNMYYQKFAAFAPASETYRGYAHNCYLQLWSEIGIFGLLAFLWPLVSVLGKGHFQKRGTSAEFDLKDAIGIGLVAYLIHSFFDTNLYSFQAAMLFWIFWGVYAGLPSEALRSFSEGGAKEGLAYKGSLGYNPLIRVIN